MYIVPVITLQQPKYCLPESFGYLTLLVNICPLLWENEAFILGTDQTAWPATDQSFLLHYKCTSEWRDSCILDELSQNTNEDLVRITAEEHCFRSL